MLGVGLEVAVWGLAFGMESFCFSAGSSFKPGGRCCDFVLKVGFDDFISVGVSVRR